MKNIIRFASIGLILQISLMSQFANSASNKVVFEASLNYTDRYINKTKELHKNPCFLHDLEDERSYSASILYFCGHMTQALLPTTSKGKNTFYFNGLPVGSIKGAIPSAGHGSFLSCIDTLADYSTEQCELISGDKKRYPSFSQLCLDGYIQIDGNNGPSCLRNFTLTSPTQ